MPGVRRGLPLILALVPGCADDPGAARAQAGALTVTQVDYRYRPQEAEAPAGRVRLTVVNRGRLAHTLRLTRGGREWIRIASQLPGERAGAAARLPPGEYRMLCAIGNHEELGMWGTLVVR